MLARMNAAAPALELDAALAEGFFDAVGLLRRRTRRVVGRPWPVETLSNAQVELLRVVRRRPGVSVAEAAADLGLAANTVSTLVRQLSDAGLVRRLADVDDKRVVRLQLTAPAQRRVEQWRDRRAGLLAEAIAGLPAADRRALSRSVPVIAKLAAMLQTEATPQPETGTA
jgi:DNA-binding MarR family transcriptional regulator